MLCLCSHKNGLDSFDEASFDALVKHLQRDGSTTADEVKVLKSSLVLCFKDRKAHQFRLQLRGGLLHRSIKTFKLDWAKRKQVGCHICFCVCNLTGSAFKSVQQ